MATFKIDAELRDDQGKGASRRLRRENKVPAIIYGGNREPRSVSVQHNKILKFVEDEAFFTSILELKAANGKRQKVILRDMQRHPAKPRIMHMDFQRIADDQVLHLNIPLHFMNEENSAAGKTSGVVISRLMNEVEVACLPGDLPEYLEVNLETFNIGDILRLSDIKLPKGVSLVAFSHGDTEEYNEVVVSASHVKGGASSTEEVTDEEGGEETAEES